MFRTFLKISLPICVILFIASFFDLKILSEEIEKDIINNPPAADIDDTILKRVTVFNEDDGLVKEEVIYEESILSEEEYEELQNELE